MSEHRNDANSETAGSVYQDALDLSVNDSNEALSRSTLILPGSLPQRGAPQDFASLSLELDSNELHGTQPDGELSDIPLPGAEVDDEPEINVVDVDPQSPSNHGNHLVILPDINNSLELNDEVLQEDNQLDAVNDMVENLAGNVDHGNHQNNLPDNEESLSEEDAQNILDVLLDLVNNQGGSQPLRNLVDAVNVQNMDNFLSVWHLHQEENGPDMDDCIALPRNIELPVAMDVVVGDMEADNMLVVLENHVAPENAIVDGIMAQDAERHVIVRNNYHHDDSVQGDDLVVEIPGLDIQLDPGVVADAEDSNDIPEHDVAVEVQVDNDDDAAVAAGLVAMEADSDSVSSSPSPRRRERRRKKRRKLEDKYVAPPGDENMGRKWANDIPEIVLLQIYSMMPDSDRFSMSRVCGNWSEIFCSARLWRERSYRFAGVYSVIKIGERAIGFAKKHSRHLKVLTITCEHPTYAAVRRFQKTMTTFLNLLLRRHSPCRLRELYLTRLGAERYWRYETIRHKFLVSFCRFLNSQNRLRVFDMSEALFCAADGFRIMEAVGRGAKNSLVMLNLEDFFKARLSLVSSERWVALLSRFQRLTTLYINYSWLSEELLLSLSNATQGRFAHLSVKVLKNDPHTHRIDGVTWHSVRKQCPQLRVQLYTEGLGSHGDFRNLLVPEMPLKSLQVWTGLHRNQEGPWHLSHTFSFLADCFTHQLEELSVCAENDSEAIDEAVLYMIQKSSALRYVDIQAVLPTNLVHTICKLQQEHKISLNRCHLILENMTGIDCQLLEDIVEPFQSMITQRKLDFNFQPNQMPFF